MDEDWRQRLMSAPDAEAAVVVDNSGWQRLLQTHVRPSAGGLNRVDYAGLQSDEAALAAYIALLERTPVEKLGRSGQFAFWCNLYNALTVKVVAEHYPVASIRDISLGGTVMAAVMGGPWKAKITSVSNIALSLDDIEHTILRGEFKDPRLHYAINCGSVGCPNLRTKPFTHDGLEAELDEAARDFINSQRGVAIEGEKLVLSGIFKWYRRDFGGDERAVLTHIARFVDGDRLDAITRGLKVDRYDYDWRLNGLDG